MSGQKPLFTHWFSKLLRRVPVDDQGQATIGARQIYILPTRAGIGYGVLLFVTLLGALNYQNNLGLLFTFVMAGVSLVSMHHAWFNLLRLRLRAQPGAPVFAGQEVQFTVTLEDLRERERGALCLRGVPGGQWPECTDLPAGGSARLTLPVPTERRGLLPLGEVVLETRYPLGLFRAWSLVAVDAVATVYPRPAARAGAPPQLTSVDHNASGDQGTGADDFVGARDYAPGDSLRRIDWKALARERGLLVKQFGGDRAARVWLDWAALPPVDDETRIALLARQVLDAAEQNLVYGLRLPGLSVERGQGDAHKHRCLTVLAGYRCED
ncbi:MULTISPECIES: DUF58 domain-containing protein [Thiorhodovibrio]|uniref:DUF58 domain-containing protein n=1 Tax=Thiorhodovibrio TaxID=61593 RepID=UPI0019128B94|nr:MULTISPECIES: DUF58 domain-containing protein [Thiorhodovibrio]MBK5967786.1 DUF58 domain-containing protein [Thiorhodovibrio winogradskyi]WPL14409.1 hypothetical protein Thiosp_04252 [Thiorhodovibrio litoralis]